ncbi:MAG TPA: sulfite reductase subunit alpha [Opitutaceae bacterium]|nr:sulfite reductase subunit alpha [Opitutaceae bacterium]
MNSVPLIPDNAPFSPEQRAWLNGFLAGIFSRGPVISGTAQASPAASAPSLRPLTILWGSQTGTAENLAKRTAKEAGKRGFAPTVVDMAQFDVSRLSQEKNVLVITSTYGDGEPPDNAKALWDALGAVTAPRCESLRFSVLALGDTNYEKFCQCGKDFDVRLEKAGGTRVVARMDCELEYEANFMSWLDSVLPVLSAGEAPTQTVEALASAQTEKTPTAESKSAYSKKNPFPARLLASNDLNGPGSAKETRHVEISLEGSGLSYEAGDALGVIPTNCPELVDEILRALEYDGEEAVIEASPAGEGGVVTAAAISLRKALLTHHDLGKPGKELLHAIAAKSGSPDLARLIDISNAKELSAWLHGRGIVDLLIEHTAAKFTPPEFVGLLRKLQPRLYSISSSPKAHPGQVHLTVGAVRYEAHNRARKGVCSTFLADRVANGGTIPVFVHHNSAFRPPADATKPMIMVGPGTGIAPFRAFLEDRQVSGATGKNWLFFGDQRGATDFLYREQLESMKSAGILTRLDLAFSRDQPEKIYVQQRMLEHAAELFFWLEAGAHFYVCGDASRMAKDVDAALHQVVERAAGRTTAQAAEYIQTLKTQKRYARDVY